MINNLYTIIYFFELHLLKVLLISFSGLAIRQILLFLGQFWIKGYHHLATYMLLPSIAYVITSVISNNLALSLGMIGALSIVRFRNPVKSPLELVMFFALLTIGISASVNISWSIFLVIIIISSLIFIQFFDKILKIFGRSAYEITFAEGRENNIIEVTSISKIDFLNTNSNLQSISYDTQTKKWMYSIAFKNKNDASKMIAELEKIKDCSFNGQFI